MSSGERPVTSDPPSHTWPCMLRRTPVSALSRVDLPEPFGPTTDTIWPPPACTDTSRITASPPYPAVMPSARRASGAALSDKVSLDHVGALSQLNHRPLGQHSPLGHHDDRVAELVHDGQLVFHHEDRDALLAQLLQGRAESAGKLGMHASHRLIQEQHVG